MNTVSQVLLILGVLLLIGGFFASIYEEYRYGVVLKYPYRDSGIILMVLGVVLIIAGAFLRTLRKPEKEEKTLN